MKRTEQSLIASNARRRRRSVVDTQPLHRHAHTSPAISSDHPQPANRSAKLAFELLIISSALAMGVVGFMLLSRSAEVPEKTTKSQAKRESSSPDRPRVRRKPVEKWSEPVRVQFSHVERPADSQIAAELESLTEARTKIVWVRYLGYRDEEETANILLRRLPHERYHEPGLGIGGAMKLMCLDSGTEVLERELLPDFSSYAMPAITANGDRVVFSNHFDDSIYIVDWDGTNLRKLSDGFALDLWSAPDDGSEWVYALHGSHRKRADDTDAWQRGNEIQRFRIDDPSKRETVWSTRRGGADVWFQPFHDGKAAVGVFPWPDVGVVSFADGRLTRCGRGCWVSVSPDGSNHFWQFRGNHREVLLQHYDAATGRIAEIGTLNINGAPAVGGGSVYHPRWSNHPRCIVITGPHGIDQQSPDDVVEQTSEPPVEIHVGRFRADYQSIENWARVTYDNAANYMPNVWIDTTDLSTERIATAKFARQSDNDPSIPSDADDWPANFDRLVFLWEDASKNNHIPPPTNRICRAEPTGRAKFGRHFVMDLTGGSFVPEQIDEDLYSACRRDNEITIEAFITPERGAQSSADGENPAAIIAFASDEASPNFVLGQQANNLTLQLNTSGDVEQASGPTRNLCPLRTEEGHHLVVTYKPGQLRCYVNGRPVVSDSQPQGDFRDWSQQHLTFGDLHSGGSDWAGWLEGIAIGSRFIDEEEAKQRFERYTHRLKQRRGPNELVVKAKLIERTKTPSPNAIAPYRRALVVHTYEIEEIERGDYDQQRVAVAHWTILDGKVLPEAVWESGKTYRLVLESLESRPELQSERIIQDSDDLSVPVFYSTVR